MNPLSNPLVRNILIVLGVAGLGFAFGRYATPEKIVTKTEVKTVEVVKEVVKKDTKKNKEVIIIRTKLPDGTERTETHIIDHGEVIVDQTKDSNTTTDAKTETSVSNAKPQWALGATYQLANGVYGAQVDRRILGPIFIQASGNTNKEIGVGLRVEF